MIDPASYRAGLEAAAHACIEAANFIQNHPDAADDNELAAVTRSMIADALRVQATSIRDLSDLGQNANVEIAAAVYMKARGGQP